MNRIFEHRAIRVRQDDSGNSPGGPSGDAEPGGGSSTAESSAGGPTSTTTSPTTTTTTSESTPTTSTTPTTTSTSSTESPTTETPTTTTTSTSSPTITSTTSVVTPTTASSSSTSNAASPTSTSTASTSTSVSSTSSSSFSSSTSNTSLDVTAPATPTASPNAATFTATQNFLPNTSAGSGTVSVSFSISPSGSAAPVATGAINTGAVVGGLFGGLAGIAILGAAFVFFIRRRKRAQDRLMSQFDAASFRRSAMIVEDERSNTPEMFQPRPAHLSISSSINGPGMAGQGAYAYRQAQEQHQEYQPYQGQYTDQPKSSAEYYTDTFVQQFNGDPQTQVAAAAGPSGAVPAQRQPIQPRQQYTFGEAIGATDTRNVISDDGHSDEAIGAYSSQPMPQTTYNAEAYANYANYHAYTPNVDESGRVYGNATRQRANSTNGDDAYGGI